MSERGLHLVALSGGVDSAVAALQLKESGHEVHCLHMTNWEEDKYCEAAADFQDARKICVQLQMPLHRINFSKEYKRRVFERFLQEHELGHTPNPDVLCNREIKFDVLFNYARRLGGAKLATGHYARLDYSFGKTRLLKGLDADKDQSYFLHSVKRQYLNDVLFPLGQLSKSQVRTIARRAGLPVSEKKSSTGICFIGERPFQPFLRKYLSSQPGPIKNEQGRMIGKHHGLPYYTIGQRQGLGIGGLSGHPPGPWYVAQKDIENNALVVVQGKSHPLLFQNWLQADTTHWINGSPKELNQGKTFRCAAKIRYGQPDQPCMVTPRTNKDLEVFFQNPQRSIAPGQYVVFYQDEHCLGGAKIRSAKMKEEFLAFSV